jgi:hypothetical protein
LFNESKNVPFTKNVMVDEDRMLDIIDQMRIAIPEEVKKAQQLLGQRDRVLAQAQEEANRTLELARQKADQMVTKDMIAAEAQRRADRSCRRHAPKPITSAPMQTTTWWTASTSSRRNWSGSPTRSATASVPWRRSRHGVRLPPCPNPQIRRRETRKNPARLAGFFT